MIILLVLVLILLILCYTTKETFVDIDVYKIAKTKEQQAKGLMYIKQKLPENSGMLFVYPQKTRASFWMKNTFIDLDVVFMDENFKVVGTIENMKAHDLTSRSIDIPYTYALEMNANSIKRLDIKPGTKINLIY